MDSYKDLIVWQKSILLVKDVYLVTAKFPGSELYGIVNQMRRSAVSIPANLAEGYARKSKKEYSQFIAISFGSATELETYLIISKELRFIDEEVYNKLTSLLTEILKMLNVLLSRLKWFRSCFPYTLFANPYPLWRFFLVFVPPANYTLVTI